MPSSIAFIEPAREPLGRGPKITQLYPNVELLVEGDPATNSLFILEPGTGPLLGGADGDRLLIIDPPGDVTGRFRLPEQTAVLHSVAAKSIGLPALQTIPGGVAHLRLGEQLLDVYSHAGGVVLHFPPLGILYTGAFGSDLVPPALAVASNGEDELETLRLLARLLKQQRIRLLLPHVGSECTELPAMMGRLAADVAYLHNLRRVALPLAGQADGLTRLMQFSESLLPASWQSATARSIHQANLSHVVQAATQPDGNT